ncbi:MAG: hypothetical protein SGJ05_01780 [bacterium]|nr:hypothetical protein [bacterium]
MNRKLFLVVLTVLFLTPLALLADFADTLNLTTPKKGVWMTVRTVTWKFDTAQYAKGRVRLDLQLMVGNNTKKAIEVGTGSFLIRLAKNDRAIYLSAMGPGMMTPPTRTIAPKDSSVLAISFVLADTGTNVELKMTPTASKTSAWLTFLPTVTSPCQRLALSSEQFLTAADVFQEFMSNTRLSTYKESRRLFLDYLKKKVAGPCTDARASDLESLSGAALKIINLDDQELNNIVRGEREATAPMSFFVSMAKMYAQKIRDQDSKK